MQFRDDEGFYNNAEAGSYHVLLSMAEKMGISGLIMNVSYERQEDSYLVYVFAGHEDYWEMLDMVDSENIICSYADIKNELKKYIKSHLQVWRDKMAEMVAEDLRPKSYVDYTATFYELVVANKGRFGMIQYGDRAEIYEQTQYGYEKKHSLQGKYNVYDIIKMIENGQKFAQTEDSIDDIIGREKTEVTWMDYL